jgi:hypothetical protein
MAMTEAERVIFLRHMAFRLVVTLWAIDTIYYENLSKGLIALAFVFMVTGVSNRILAYQLTWAKVRERREAERIKQEKAAAKRLEAEMNFKKAQAESSEKYFDLADAQ